MAVVFQTDLLGLLAQCLTPYCRLGLGPSPYPVTACSTLALLQRVFACHSGQAGQASYPCPFEQTRVFPLGLLAGLQSSTQARAVAQGVDLASKCSEPLLSGQRCCRNWLREDGALSQKRFHAVHLALPLASGVPLPYPVTAPLHLAGEMRLCVSR